MRVMMMLSSIAMGGAEKNVVSVLPYLKQKGVEVCLGTLNTRRDSPLAETFAKTGVPRFDMGATRMIDTTAWANFRKVLRDQKIDIVHSEDQDVNLYATMAHLRLGMPTVMTRHVMFEPNDTLKEKVRAQMILWAARVGFSRIVAVSEATRQKFSQQTGVSLAKIKTIYNGIDLEKFNTRHKRDAKRAEMGWTDAQKIIVMVAVLRRGKGHEVLFEAIPQILQAVPNAKIKLVGEGELSDPLREQAKPYGDSVEFLGQRMDVAELLGASDVLVLPSWSEALPTVLIEAGAASLPCVATNVGGTAEIVDDSNTGFVVPAGDSAQLAKRLIDVLHGENQVQNMGKQAYERVNRLFSFEQQTQATIALYEDLLRSKT
jgi:glycosyltransferase involved in cell wall biosynthesis